jgi:hypothetical protein
MALNGVFLQVEAVNGCGYFLLCCREHFSMSEVIIWAGFGRGVEAVCRPGLHG